MGKPVRLALVMGGGVSLGSFSSGALAELVRLIARFPGTRESGAVPLEPEIDVMTGASAGAMTLSILLRSLVEDASVEQIGAAMSECWVEGVGLDYPAGDPRQLLPDLRAHATASLLRDGPIVALRTRHIERPFQTGSRASRLLGDTVLVSFALSNLNGIDIRAPWQTIRPDTDGGDDALVTTFFEDRMRFRFDKTDLAPGPDALDRRTAAWRLGREPSTWERLGLAATASGAFPAAFVPVRMERRREELGAVWPEQLGDACQRFPFTYVDGGVFNNEPLKEAIELAAIRDAGMPPDTYERVFVLIDPSVSGTSAAMALGFDHPLALEEEQDDRGRVTGQTLLDRGYAPQLLAVLARTASAVAGQATFRDWIKMARTNVRLEWGAQLQTLLANLAGSVEVAAVPMIRTQLGGILEQVYGDRERFAPAGATAAATALDRDRTALTAGMASFLEALPALQQELAVDMALLLRNVAGLRDKRPLRFVAISPWSLPRTENPPIRLAGNFMGNFGGFFQQAWRAHDHRCGRWLAHDVLTRQIGDAERLISPAATRPPGAEARPALPQDPDYWQVPSRVRGLFEDVLHDHLENICSAVGVPDFADDIVASKVADKLVKAIGSGATVRYLVVRIGLSLTNWRDLELDAGELGSGSPEPIAHGDGHVLETVLALTFRPDHATPHAMSGPHLHVGAETEIRVSRSGTQQFRVIFEDTPANWYASAGRSRVFETPRPMGGGPVRVRPALLDA